MLCRAPKLQPSPRRDELTVLELLVAMSIIAVSASLLLPALAVARESSRRVQCADHLPQFGIALHNHRHSHDSLLWSAKVDGVNNQSADECDLSSRHLEES